MENTTYLLCFIVTLNVALLIEQIVWHCRQQESEGKIVGYGRTFIFYILEIIVIGAVVYGALRFFNLG